MKVVMPDPEGPVRMTISPGRFSILTSNKACSSEFPLSEIAANPRALDHGSHRPISVRRVAICGRGIGKVH